MERKLIVVSLVVLLVGVGGGYVLGKESVLMDENAHDQSRARVSSGESEMKHEMEGMMMGLDSKDGDAFDQAFLSEMIVHHQGAVDMAEAALKDAKHAEIKDLAQNIIAAQNTEIAQMKEWQKTWYGK